MAFTARAEAVSSAASLTTPFNFTINKATGVVDGDIMFMFLSIMIATPATVDAIPGNNWTLVATNATSNVRWYLYYRVASGEGASYVWSLSKSCRYYAVNAAYTAGDWDVASISDITAISNTLYATAGVPVRAASMSVPAANSPLLYFASVYSTTSKTFTKPTVPTTGWVEDSDLGGTTPDLWATHGSMIWASSGATGVIEITCSATITTEKHAFAISLKPSVATSPIAGIINGVTSVTGTPKGRGKLSGTIAAATSGAVYTDDFEAYTALTDLGGQGNWLASQGSMVVVDASGDNRVYPNSAQNSASAYNATFSNDQYSQVVLDALVANSYIGPGVRISGSGATVNGYFFYANNSFAYFDRFVNGTWQELRSGGGTFTAGDILRMEISGSVITVYQNGSQFLGGSFSSGSITDTNLTSGQAGISGYGGDAATRADDWEGGDLGAGGGVISVSGTLSEAAGGTTSPISGTINGVSTVTGSLIAEGILSGIIGGVASVSGILRADGILSGTINGVTNVLGNLSGSGILFGIVNGSAIVSGSLSGKGKLISVINGSTVVTGVLTAEGKLTGIINGVVTVTGILKGRGTLYGTIGGITVVLGDIYDATILNNSLAGVINGVTIVTGILEATGLLTGISTGIVTVTGILRGRTEFIGVINGVTIVTGLLTARGKFIGTINGITTVTGVLRSWGKLLGVLNGATIITGSLGGFEVGSLSGESNGVTIVTGGLGGRGNLAGVIGVSGSISTGYPLKGWTGTEWVLVAVRNF